MGFVQRIASTVVASHLVNQNIPLSAAKTTTVGNKVFLALRVDSGSAVTGISDSKGNTWTLDQSSVSATNRAHLAHAQLTAALIGLGDSVTVTLSPAGQIAAAIFEYSGVVASGSPDVGVVAGSATAALTGSAGPTATTAQPDEIALSVAAVGTSQASFTVPDGFTERATGQGQLDFAEKVLSATGAVTAAYSWPTSSNWGIALETFRLITQVAGVTATAVSAAPVGSATGTATVTGVVAGCSSAAPVGSVSVPASASPAGVVASTVSMAPPGMATVSVSIAGLVAQSVSEAIVGLVQTRSARDITLVVGPISDSRLIVGPISDSRLLVGPISD
jgi:hypothetical protein